MSSDTSTSIRQELATLVAEIRTHWLQPVPSALPQLRRFGYAYVGSLSWLVGTLWQRVELTLSRFSQQLEELNLGSEEILLTYLPLLWIPVIWIPLIVLGLLLPAWFGWLVSWRDRKVGPIRLYLEGILLPMAVMLILGLFSPEF